MSADRHPNLIITASMPVPDVMVIPRSRSCAIKSMTVSPSCTSAKETRRCQSFDRTNQLGGTGSGIHTSDGLGLAAVEQHALGRCGLAGVDVRHDPNVADTLQLCATEGM